MRFLGHSSKQVCSNMSIGQCGFHANSEHFIDECVEFKSFVHHLMDMYVLQVCHPRKGGEVLMGEMWNTSRPKSLVIQFSKATPMRLGRQPLEIQTPSSFPLPMMNEFK